jgi:hypothetical protein
MAACPHASAWAALLHAMSDIQLAAVHILDRNARKINVSQASNIDTPFIGSRSRSPKWQDAAYGAEVVFRDLRVPFISAQLVDRREQSQSILIDPMNEGTSAATYRAVANAYVIEISVHFELDFAAVATAAVRFFHGV